MIALRLLSALLAISVTFSSAQSSPARTKTRNIILVTTDGLRWQDVFRGAEPELLNKEHGNVANLAATKEAFWRETPAARREVLMPFLWSAIRGQGQIYGNHDLGSDMTVTNKRNFSYPGYNELLTGAADDRIDSNDKKPNPNVSVLEWLHQQRPGYKNRVAAFGAWDVFPYILNATRSGLFVNAGYDAYPAPSPKLALLNRLKKETAIWEGEPLDSPMFLTALEHFRTAKPRVLYIGLGDTDEWAHSGRYDLYLHSAHRVDEYLRELWEMAQSMPEYRGNTTLILTVDHGRGSGLDTWRNHGEKVPESKHVWFAILGPDTPARGELANAAPVTQSQIAATMAALLGEDYLAFNQKAGAVIATALGR